MDCIRKIVLSAVFFLGIISCITTGLGERGNMALDTGFTISNDKFSLYHPDPHGSGRTAEDINNILDNNDSTRAYFYKYTGVTSSFSYSEQFILTPVCKGVTTLRLKIYTDDEQGKRNIIVRYKKESNSGYIILSEGEKNIDTTFNIFSSVYQIEIIVNKWGDRADIETWLKVWFYTLDIGDGFEGGMMYGRDPDGIIQFADVKNGNSGLKYKASDGKEHKVFLVAPSNPIASNFRIKTENGIFALAKWE